MSASKEPYVLWPACTYMDGMAPVELEAGEEDYLTRTPPAWVELFKQHRRQGKHPYMCMTLLPRSEQSAVARAFRNFCRHVYDHDGARIPDADYEGPP